MKFRTRCIGKALLVVVGIGVLGAAVMLLWNWVVPALFVGARTIDFAHALGLLVLSRILFGGFRGGGGGWRERRHWRKWNAMTPEERERMQAAWASRQRPGRPTAE